MAKAGNLLKTKDGIYSVHTVHDVHTIAGENTTVTASNNTIKQPELINIAPLENCEQCELVNSEPITAEELQIW